MGSVGNIEWPVKLYTVPWINKGRKIKIHQMLIKLISSNHGQLSLLRVSVFVSIRKSKITSNLTSLTRDTLFSKPCSSFRRKQVEFYYRDLQLETDFGTRLIALDAASSLVHI